MYFSWGSSLGKELKYISVYPTAYILVMMVHCCTHVCAINSILFSQQGMAVRMRTEDHRHVLISTAIHCYVISILLYILYIATYLLSIQCYTYVHSVTRSTHPHAQCLVYQPRKHPGELPRDIWHQIPGLTDFGTVWIWSSVNSWWTYRRDSSLQAQIVIQPL